MGGQGLSVSNGVQNRFGNPNVATAKAFCMAAGTYHLIPMGNGMKRRGRCHE